MYPPGGKCGMRILYHENSTRNDPIFSNILFLKHDKLAATF
jgi:hypothetical protein